MSDEVSLIFYLASFSVAALLMWWGIISKSKIVVGVSLLVPILVSALRFNVGTDYVSYVQMFHSLSVIPIGNYFTEVFPKIEIGFYLLIQLSSWLTNGPFLVFLISAALSVGFFYAGLKKYGVKHQALVYLLYLLIIFPTTFNGIRQGIAAAICFYAITFIISRKPGKYLLWIFIASLFHVSALFLIPLYLVNLIVKNNKKDSLLKTFLVIGGTMAAVLLSLPYIFDFLATIPIFETYVQYLVPNDDGFSSSFNSKFAILFLAVIAIKWIVQKEDKNKYHYFIIFSILEVLISTFGFSLTIDRMALYFTFFSIFIITSFADVFKDVLGKSIMYFLIIMYAFVYFYLAYYVQGYADIFPYQPITHSTDIQRMT